MQILTIKQELIKLKHEYLSGKYDEVVEKSDSLLKEEIPEKERIELLILKSRCYFFLQQRDKNPDHRFKGLEIAKDAYNQSKKFGDNLLIFESSYWCLWLYKITRHQKEIIELFEEIKEVFFELEKSHPNCKNLREIMFREMESESIFQSKGLEGKAEADSWESNHQILLEAVSLIELEEDPEDILYIESKMRYYSHLGGSWSEAGEYEKAVEWFEKSLELVDKMNNNFWRIKLQTAIIKIHWRKGEYNEVLDKALEILETSKKLGIIRGIASSSAHVAKYYFEIGEFKKALKYSLDAYNACSEDGKREDTVDWLDHVGVAYAGLGELDKAEEVYEKILKYSRKINWQWNIYSTKENLSEIYLSKGELDKAIESVEEAGEYYEKNGMKFDFAWNVFNQHRPYLKKGLVNEAIQRLEKSIVLFKELGNLPRVANSLFYLINITSQNNMNVQTETYFEEYSETMKKIDDPKIKRLHLLAEGVMLKNSRNTRDRVRAEVLFDQLLLEDLGFHIKIELLFNQCDLLLSELKQTGDERVLVKLKEYVDSLVETSTKYKHIELNIKSMWLKSQISILEADIENANDILSQALVLAEEKGYRNLALKITSSKEEVIKLIINKEDSQIPESSIKEKITNLKLVESFEEIKEVKAFDLSDLKLKTDI